MDRKTRDAIAKALRAAHKSGVANYQEPATHGIRLHAYRVTVDAVVASLTLTNANFDAAKFRAAIGPFATPANAVRS